ncbi:hypothetical protein BOO86_04520 [Mycobacterium sp. CBMA 234]|uniref:copper resistance CopC family protein n=1 Tax=Mycolicibacterium sp. CBMA 234 TaxID=1918495 RepID=UPI0012DC1728|nr:copper resistance CopC family protein [Mycolicibacterium sp. CBMA 234]MUL63719.1 hypothetical protein [Mycolicibacterium sp. CBMA 234]
MKHIPRSTLTAAALRICVASAVASTVLVQAPIASAHVAIVSTTPARGSTVSVAPTQVSMLFSEPPISTRPILSVTGPDGKTYSSDTPYPSGAALNVQLHTTPPQPPGTYTVTWQVTADDGHVQNGSWSYTLQNH